MKLQGLRQLLASVSPEESRAGAPSARDKSKRATAASGARSQVMQLMDELDRLQSELEQANQRVVELETIADEDPLVPALNRRSFMRELDRTIAYASRYKTRVSLVYCDLDELKKLNDQFGHAAGDAALAFFAEWLVASTRKSDIIGRLGGDEFAVILHYADQAAASEKADRLMQQLSDQRFEYDGRKIGLSMSAGATEVRADDAAKDVLERADRAMYAYKSRLKGQRGTQRSLSAAHQTAD